MPRRSKASRSAKRNALKGQEMVRARIRRLQELGNPGYGDRRNYVLAEFPAVTGNICDQVDSIQVYKLDEDTEEWVQMSGEIEQVLNPATSMAEPPSGGEGDSSNDTCKKRKMSKYPAMQANDDILTEQKSVSQTLKDIQSHLHVLTSHNDDYHDTFGKYIASLLRSLPPQKALALQPKIVSLITEAEKANVEGQPEAEEFEGVVMKFDRDDD